MSMKIASTLSVVLAGVFGVNAHAGHVKGFIEEVVVKHKEGSGGVVLMSFKDTEYDSDLPSCANYFHEVGFDLADDPSGSLFSLVMMSQMSGSKVFFRVESNCLSGMGVAEIEEGRTGVN